MRQVVAALSLACCLVAVPAGDAHAAAHGSIKGVVVNQATHQPQAGVVVHLIGANSDGSESISKTQKTARDGRFQFEGLQTGDQRFYAVDGIFQGGRFAGRPVKLPSDTSSAPVINSTLRVWPTTTDPTLVGLAHDDIFAVGSGDSIGIVESDEIVNASPDHAYIGRGGRSNKSNVPTIGFSLPAAARSSPVSIADSDIEIPNLVRTDFGFGATVAIPPGPTRVTFTYKVPGDNGTFDLTRVALYPIVELSVFAEDPLVVSSNRLQDKGPKTIGGKTYERYSTSGSVASGDPIQVQVAPGSETSVGLIAGAAAGGALILIGLFVFFVRLRRVRRPVRSTARVAPTSDDVPEGRDEIVVAIAELDLRHQAGEVPDGAYEVRRAKLKKALESLAELPT